MILLVYREIKEVGIVKEGREVLELIFILPLIYMRYFEIRQSEFDASAFEI